MSFRSLSRSSSSSSSSSSLSSSSSSTPSSWSSPSAPRSGARERARYGLRAQHVGEASHPGPHRLEIRRSDGTPAILSCSISQPAWARNGAQYYKWQVSSEPRLPGPMRQGPKEALAAWLLKHDGAVHVDDVSTLTGWSVSDCSVALLPAARARSVPARAARLSASPALDATLDFSPTAPELCASQVADNGVGVPQPSPTLLDASMPSLVAAPAPLAPELAAAAAVLGVLPPPPLPPAASAPFPAAAAPAAPDVAGSPSWMNFLDCLDGVHVCAELMHPVRSVREVPSEHVAGFLDTLEHTAKLLLKAIAVLIWSCNAALNGYCCCCHGCC